MTRGHRGSLALRCRTLSFLAPCRFIPAHQEFLAGQKDWLEVRRLPGYAPELNPAEGFWANLKGRELANRCEAHVRTVNFAAHLAADRVRRDRHLLSGFLRYAGLNL